jgi:hypothetical protein
MAWTSQQSVICPRECGGHGQQRCTAVATRARLGAYDISPGNGHQVLLLGAESL